VTDEVFGVRSPFGVKQFTVGLVLTAFSVVFIVAGISRPDFGGILFLLIGVAGVVLFAGGTVLVLGQYFSHRPAFEFDREGIRLPARWPRPPSDDRFLPWPEVAAVVACEITGGGASRYKRRLRSFRLVFLPTSPGAAVSPEMLALCVTRDVPGIPTLHWSVRVTVTEGASLKEIVAVAQGHRDVPFLDARLPTEAGL
jgi:hypothetical protein